MSELEHRGERAPIPSAWEHAPPPESREIVELQERYGIFVGGEFVEPRSGDYYETLDPASEEPLAEIPQAGPEDVALAVESARDAFENGWSAASPAERAKYLFRIARILQERSREFAVLESLNGGKPIRESRDVDLPLAAAHFFYYAGWADKLEYAFPHRRPQPLGVAGQIIPWNFPLLMLAWKIAPALAGGNTVVLKPAETTPLSALLFCDVLRQAELPPGVVNIVTGNGATGAAIVTSEVDKIAFTGSTEVGKAIQRELAGTGKKLTLELGGKAANIIFDDAALDQAVEGIINGIYFNQGHVCCAGSRLLVQESIYEPVVEKLKRRLATLRVGDPLDKNTDVGAINSKQQLDKIEELVAVGKDEGAEIYQPPCRLPEKGYWFVPTVFTNVAQSYRIAQEEIFGPVLSILTFRTPDEALEKANNTPYGLSAGVWTEKGSRILWMAERLRAGVIWANTYNRFDPSSPFGGYKESAFRREGGRHGLGPYLRFPVPEPTGVVGVLCPEEPALLGLVTRLLPPLVGGNAVVAVASEAQPLAAVELAEALATSDFPGGVVNILTGLKRELAPVLAAHMDVNALDLAGADGDVAELERAAAANVKRVVHGAADVQSPWEVLSFLELKTVWHPIGV